MFITNALHVAIIVFSFPFIKYNEKIENKNKKTKRQYENKRFELIAFSLTFSNKRNSLIFSEAKSKPKTVIVRIKIITPAASYRKLLKNRAC